MAEATQPVPPGATPPGGEERFRDLLDRLPQTVFEIDLEGRFTYVNQAGLDAFGYAAEDLRRGIAARQVVVPEQRERLRANIGRRLAGGVSGYFEYTALRKDGGTFPCLVHAVPILREGRPVGLQGFLIDITERVRGEDALRYRIDFERLIMGISTKLVAVSPAEVDAGIADALAAIGRFMDVDRSYVFLFSDDGALMDNTHEWVADGVSAERERLQRIEVEAAFPWFSRELRERQVLVVPAVAELPPLAAAERAEFERQGIRSLINVAMVQGGRLVGFLGLDSVRRARFWSPDEAALLRVVGELFTGAILRTRAESALRESEGSYKALVESTATGFVILDDLGRVLDANAEYVRLTGRGSLGEISGRTVTEWTAAHDQERNAREVRRCFERGFVRNLQIDYVHPDGTVLPVEINAAVVEARGSRRILTVIRDVSERKRLEAEMLRSEKLRSVGVLAGGIAHDFNNILTAILGSISLLRETLRPEGAAAELMAEAEQASLRARELTRQLLTFSRGGAPVRKTFNPGDLVRESAALALRGRGSGRELKIAGDLWPIAADEGQVGQVINNLIINASQAMAGGGTVVVTAANVEVGERDALPVAPGKYVAITVADRGAGIPEEHRSRIFDPYFTTKQEGSGLGLAVCYAVVTNHGGTISVTSEPGRGSAFTVHLPAATGTGPERAEAALRPVRGRGRVLVMDDEEMVRTVAGKILRALGYESEAARHGREAIERWQQARLEGRPFDLAILDLTVPGGMGGREAVRELLALDPQARVVVSSGYSQDPVVANYREYGFRDLIAKPYSVAEISRVLARHIGRAGC